MQRRLMYGYEQGLPNTVEAAWGARLIISQDGWVDLVWDRQSTFGDEQRVSELMERLNDDGALGVAVKRTKELLLNWEMQLLEDTEYLLFDDKYLTIKGNPRGSGGYLYVCAYLKPRKA